IILQDDQAKVPLGISAISRSFRTIQSINEPVIVLDYNFSVSSQQKFVPSVYLIINLSDINDTL
ncbi:8984_t:CDS:1, partial [Cetraspora pellucida]